MIYEPSALAVLVFAVFVALTLGISFYFAARTRSARGYFAAGGGILGAALIILLTRRLIGSAVVGSVASSDTRRSTATRSSLLTIVSALSPARISPRSQPASAASGMMSTLSVSRRGRRSS